MSTASNIKAIESGHWYTTDGKAAYQQPKADGTGMTPTTLRHARKLNLLPSVTTILKVLDKPALTAWKIEQAVNAVLTSPRNDGEGLDEFVKRVLSRDREQDQERDAAAKLGTDIHAAIESALAGHEIPGVLARFVSPVCDAVLKRGCVIGSEVILCGDGYAGKTDLIIETENGDLIVDFKTTKKLPKDSSWPEHRLQLAAYAAARFKCVPVTKKIETANVYISTVEPGAFVISNNPPWEPDYLNGFLPVVKHWQWANDYQPQL